MSIRVLLADDQPLLRGAFRLLIESAPDLEVAGEAGTGREAVALTTGTGADVVLMDIRMPEMDGLAATREIVASGSAARVLILTTFEIDEYVYEALRAGASGFLGKSAEPADLLNAVRTVHGGEALLSPAATKSLIARFLADRPPLSRRLEVLTGREREIVTLVAGGFSNGAIATRLVLSPHTVKTHVNRAMTKLGAHDRAQLVVIAYEGGLIPPKDGGIVAQHRAYQ